MSESQPHDLSRRQWVKRFVLGSAAALGADRWCETLLAEVGDPLVGPGKVRLSLSDYPALASVKGCVQLNFSELFAPFTLNRVSATRFVALDSVCTHAGCTVGKFVVGTNGNPDRMQCPCHGSRYTIEGKVFRDGSGQSTEPAPDDLRQFTTRFDESGGIVEIEIPELALQIFSIRVASRNQSTGSIRLQLRFPTTLLSKYEVRYQASLGGNFSVIPFATTPAGPANQTSLVPVVAGPASVYVEATGTRGFFTVAVVLTNV